jgi:hypothetical protein
MGYMTSVEIADSGLTMEQAIGWHLQGNHYPPVPLSMVEPCITAIDAYWADDCDALIPMPEGVSYKGKSEAPAWAIIEQHHLGAWTTDYDYDADYDV